MGCWAPMNSFVSARPLEELVKGVVLALPFALMFWYGTGDASEAIAPFVIVTVVWVVFATVRHLAGDQR